MNNKNNDSVAGHSIVHTYIHSITIIIINGEEVLNNVLSLPNSTQLSRDIQADAGFVCDNSAVLGGTVKGPSCTFESRRQNTGKNHYIKIANKSVGIAAKLKYGYLGITLIRSKLLVWGKLKRVHGECLLPFRPFLPLFNPIKALRLFYCRRV